MIPECRKISDQVKIKSFLCYFVLVNINNNLHLNTFSLNTLLIRCNLMITREENGKQVIRMYLKII